MKILAGIVLFNPDIERLKQNAAAILPQVDCLLAVDNGSTNLEEIEKALPDSVRYLENGRNMGIAAALNSILHFAEENNYDWFITLDQDSVCEAGLIENYKQHIALPSAAVLSCTIVDRNIKAMSNRTAEQQTVEIKECITSASFCNTKALTAVGGFDEEMFIDSVDFDLCLNLRKHGFKIYKTPYVGLLHEVGHGRNVKLFWQKRVVYNHSPLRNYYMARNHVYMAKKYPQDISMLRTRLKEWEREILILLYETDKVKKLKARREGFKDGQKQRMGECTWL